MKLYNMSMIYGGAGSAAIAAEQLDLEVLFNYETRGKHYLDTFNSNFANPHQIATFPLAIDNWDWIKERNLNCDIIVGQPDCKMFSRLMTRKEPEKDIKRTQLYDFMLKIQELYPLVFIVENLSKGISALMDFLIESEIDYDFSGKVKYQITVVYNLFRISLNTKHFVPQSRNRDFLIGIHNTLNVKSFNLKQPKDLFEGGVKKVLEDIDEPILHERLPNHQVPNHSKKRIEGFKKLKYKESFYGTQNNRRLHPDENCGAITSHCTCYVHYKQPRTLTARENARIMGFPDDFIFKGNKTQCLDQVGKAISPPVIKYILKHILDLLKDK